MVVCDDISVARLNSELSALYIDIVTAAGRQHECSVY